MEYLCEAFKPQSKLLKKNLVSRFKLRKGTLRLPKGTPSYEKEHGGFEKEHLT